MTEERIVIDPKVMFGKPIVRGTRITVEHILRKIGAGMTEEQIIEHHPHLSPADIQAAATFAAGQLASEELVLSPG